jgi:hypothetical protein
MFGAGWFRVDTPRGRFRSIVYDMPESKLFQRLQAVLKVAPLFFRPLPVLTSAPEPREKITKNT